MIVGGTKYRAVVVECDETGCSARFDPPVRTLTLGELRRLANTAAAGWHTTVVQYEGVRDFCPDHALRHPTPPLGLLVDA